MQSDRTGISFSVDEDGVTVRVPTDLVEKVAPLVQVLFEYIDVKRELQRAFAEGQDPKDVARKPFVVFLAGWCDGLLSTLCGEIPLTPTDQAAEEAAGEAAYERYAARYGLTVATAQSTAASLSTATYAARGPYTRPVPPWDRLSRSLLKCLISHLKRGEPVPTLKGMCLEFNRQHVSDLTESPATLSRWVNDSRREAGLSGGYRAAMAELVPIAREQVEIAVAAQARDQYTSRSA